MENALEHPNRQLDRTRPLIPVSFLKNRETRLPEEWTQCAAPVARTVMVDRVVVSPENLERWNREKKRPRGREQ